MSQTMIVMFGALVAELLLLVLVLLGVSYARNRAARRRDLKAIRALIAQVKKDKPQREQAVERFLADGLGMSGDTLGAAKSAILRAELGLLQRFAAIYRGREAPAAARFHADVALALEPYHALSGTAVAGEADDGDVEAPDTAELDSLRKENQRLENELRITMETMSRMLNEYSTMFADKDGDEPPIVGGDDDEAIDEGTDGAIDGAVSRAAEPALEAAEGVDDDFEVSVGLDDSDEVPPEEPVAVDDDPVEGAGLEGDDQARQAEPVATETDTAEQEPIADTEAAETVDPVEEILRQAATQEQMAKGAELATNTGDTAGDADDGAIEVMLDDAPAVAAVQQPDDDLFDAAPVPGPGPGDDAKPAEAFDADDVPLKSQSGS